MFMNTDLESMWNEEEVSFVSTFIWVREVKVKLSLCFIFFYWAPHQEVILGCGCIAPCILDLGTRWRWVVSFTLQPLYPQGRAPCTHWIGGWVGPELVWTQWWREKFLSLTRTWTPPLSYRVKKKKLLDN
jgi:hypothetical protein